MQTNTFFICAWAIPLNPLPVHAFTAFTIKPKTEVKGTQWMSGPQQPNQSLQALSHTPNQQTSSGCRFQMLVSRLSHAIKIFRLVMGHYDYSLPVWPFPCFQATEVKWMCAEYSVGNPLTPLLMTSAGVLVSASVYDNLCDPLTLI